METTSIPPGAPPPAQASKPKVVVPVLEKREAKFQPPRIVLNAVEGWGKTSCGAYAPKPAILCARDETGYETLLGAGLVPNVPAVTLDTWDGYMALLDSMVAQDTIPYKTLVIDAMIGFERLNHEMVCKRDFGNEWGAKGFASYAKGYDMSVNSWLAMLDKLDRIRAKGVAILMLGHSLVKNHKNPMGEDFDRYISDLHHKAWGCTKKWSDAALFGMFETIVDDKDGVNKGIGGANRVLYTEYRDAYDAKNRYRMDNPICIPDDPSKIWPTIWAQIYKPEVK